MPRFQPLFSLVLASLAAGITPAVHAAAFNPNDLVVYTSDSGATALSSAAASVSLYEFSPTLAGQLAPVQIVPISTDTGLAGNNFTASGSASSEGGLSRSADGTFLAFGGVNVAAGTATANNSTSRLMATVGPSGAATYSAPFTVSSGANLRSVAANNSGMLYLSTNNGTLYAAGVGSTPVSLNTTNVRGIGIAGGQLYASAGSATAPQFITIGSGLPTASPAAAAAAFGLGAANSAQNSFRLFDLNSDGTMDTLYLSLGGGTGGVQRYNISGGTATLAYTLDSGVNIFGLTARLDPLNSTLVDLFATTQGGANGANSLIALTDSAAVNNATSLNAAIVTLATAGADQSFRGVDFAPAAVPEPSSLCASALGAFACVAAVLRRHGGQSRIQRGR